MMTQDRDYEDALRRALTAAAESIEPAGDGLQRIRHRLDSRRSPRSCPLRVRRVAGVARNPFSRPARTGHGGRPDRTEADRAAGRPGQFPARPAQPACGPASWRASRGGRLAGPPGARRTLAQAGARGLGGRGHRRGRRGHPQPRDGNPHLQPVELRHHAQQPGLWPGRRRDDVELQAVEAAARGHPSPAPTGPGEHSIRVEEPATRGGLHPDPVAERDHDGSGRDDDPDPDRDPDRHRPATSTPATPSPTDTGQPTPTPTSSTATGSAGSATTTTTTAKVLPDLAGGPDRRVRG